MQPVDRFGGDGDSGVKAKASVGSAQVIVDGLGNAHHLDALLDQRIGHTLGVIASDGNQRVQPVGLDVGQAFVDAALHLARVGA